MKKFFLFGVALTMAAMSYAQNTLVATLSHGATVKMFYGSNALCDAHNAAQSGDVINLSGGVFQAVDITKALTLRGTGIDDASPTYISGDFTINIPNTTRRLTMEGLRCTGSITMSGTFNSPYFVKSQFYAFSYEGNAAIKNAMFANCRISGGRYYGFYLKGTSTVQFVNSYVNCFHNEEHNNTAAAFINCVIQSYQNGYYANYIINSQLLNCIIYQCDNINNNLRNDDSRFRFPSSTIATNCLSIGYSALFNSHPANTGNKSVNYNEFSKVFKSFTGTYSESEQFKLTATAKKTYLGNDGTEVGMHGGILPYNTTPSYPQITKMNVANKTTADGKLSVEIEVSAPQQ